MKLRQILIFGNLYISLCAVVMCIYTYHTIGIDPYPALLFFVFFSTLTSYSFHWYLTPDVTSPSPRFEWVDMNKNMLILFFIISTSLTLFYLYLLREHFLILIISAIFTFIYSAAKIPTKPFIYFRNIVLAKTAYLAGIWTLVTSVYPVLFSGINISAIDSIYILNRFFLIYTVCILFDYRDKEEDIKNMVRNLMIRLSIRSLSVLYYSSLTLFFISAGMLFYNNFLLSDFIINIFPGILLIFSFKYSIRTKSDYWYYFYLDGLMMLSGVLLIVKLVIGYFVKWLIG